MRILIVDDDKTSRMAMKKILLKFGRCSIAVNGSRALDEYRLAYFASDSYDLIILDYTMPDLSGPELLSKIRKIEQRVSIPKEQQVKVMMATVRNDLESVRASVSVGCQEYVVKPIVPDTIIEKVKKLGFSPLVEDSSPGESIIDDKELREIFIEEFGNRIQRLKEAVDTSTIKSIQEVAHQLHGTGATYGFDEVSSVGAEIETAAKTGDWPAIKTGINTLSKFHREYQQPMESIK